jgi:hypothetical protein
MTPLDRFFAKLKFHHSTSPSRTGCWEWTGAKTRGGASARFHRNRYGALWVEGRTVRAHRWIYELIIGPIPDSKELDHLCDFSLCVNPYHLQPATKPDNARRAAYRTNSNRRRKQAAA